MRSRESLTTLNNELLMPIARWMAGGLSAHFEFRSGTLRVRTDFVTRPPRLQPDWLARLWKTIQSRQS